MSILFVLSLRKRVLNPKIPLVFPVKNSSTCISQYVVPSLILHQMHFFNLSLISLISFINNKHGSRRVFLDNSENFVY